MWGIPTVDLFATRLSRKVEAFYSRLPNPLALPGDPLVADCSKGLLYLYPPLALLCSSTLQDCARGSPGDHHHPMVALPRLVTQGSPTPVRPAGVVASARQSPHRGRWGGLPRSPHTLSSRLETLRRSLRRILAHAANTICAAHRPSTRDLYHAKWQCCITPSGSAFKDPLHSCIRTVLGYLQHLQSRGLKHYTILTHISALSNCTDRIEGFPVHAVG